jgi:PAS domain S-box-containing protein
LLPLNDEYRGFLDLIAGQVATAVASARAYAEERRRAEELAELDRVKTAFYSQLSHEFPTSLNSMLGPVEDVPASPVDEPLSASPDLLARVASRIDLDRLRGQAERERRQGEERSRAILESITDAFFAVGHDWRFTYVNAQAERLMARKPGELLGKDIWQEYPGLVGSDFGRAYRRAAEHGIPASITAFYPDHGRWYEAHVYPGTDGITIYFRDASDRVRAEGERERFFAVGADLLVLVGFDGRFLQVGSSCERTLGWTPEELTSRPWIDFIHPDDRQATLALGGQIAAGREVVSFENRYIHKDGSYRWLNWKVKPFPAERIIYAGATDVTERKLAEQAVRESEAKYRALAEAMPFIVWQAGPTGRSEYANAFSFAYTGLTPDEVRERGWLPAIHPDDVAGITNRWTQSLRTGEPVEVKYRMRRASDGQYRWFRSVGTPVKDDQGQVVRWIGAAIDIHDQRIAEEALRGSELRYRTLAEALPNLVWTARADGSCDWLSSQWTRYTGNPDLERSSQLWLESIHPDDRERTVEHWLSACRDLNEYDLEYRIRRFDGQYHWFKTRGVKLRSDRGEIVYWFGTCTDIEDVKRMEAALREADRRKDEFLAMLAHELRNPLAPIRNAVSVMAMAGDDPSSWDWARQVIDRQVRHLASLVDDLLDVGRINQGKITLELAPLTVSSFVETAVEASRPSIDARRHHLEVAVPEQAPRVEGDLTRLTQVVQNLLNNAAKYTPEGGHIHLSVGDEGGFAVIRVRDDGVGIPADMLPKVFDLFTQVERSIDRSEGGLGIGLTLVRRLTELHGGTVEARSEGPGRGSEFVLRLPLLPELAPATALPAPAANGNGNGLPKGGPHRVLVVDDSRDSAETLARLLRRLGHTVEVAHDGPSAFEAAPGFGPDLALLDIGLPGMDGYQLARALRREPSLGRLHLVALTGYGSESDRIKSAEAGFDDHLVKPVEFDDLRAILDRSTVGHR